MQMRRGRPTGRPRSLVAVVLGRDAWAPQLSAQPPEALARHQARDRRLTVCSRSGRIDWSDQPNFPNIVDAAFSC
jgi:hypothetical protein